MSSIKLDLKNFKYESADKDSTTLVHKKDNHKITLAHKALSKANREQLEAMIPKEEKQMMANGGEIKEKMVDEARKIINPPQPTPEQEKNYQKNSIRNDLIDFVGLPNTLKETEADRIRYDANAPMAMGAAGVGTIGSKIIPPVMNIAQPVSKVGGILDKASKGAELINKPVIDGKALQNANIINTKHRNYLDSLGPMPKIKNYADGGEVEDEIPNYLQPNSYDNVIDPETPQEMIDQTALESMNPLAEMADLQYSGRDPSQAPNVKILTNPEVQAKVQEATQAGLTVPQMETVKENPVVEQTPLPAEIAQTEQSIAPQEVVPQGNSYSMNSAYDKQLAGINAEANAAAQLGQEQQKILDQQVRVQQEVQQNYDQKYAELDNERKAFVDDINSQHIDPEKYWTGDPKTGMGSHSKIMAGIGMIIAGFNPTNSPNAAIKFIEKQMDMNLDAQKQNLQSKHNLLAANMRQFGNLKDATDMTRLMQADMVKNQLMAAAAKAQTPMAKAAAMKAAGQLEAQYAPLQAQMANRQVMFQLEKQAQQDPKAAEAYIEAVSRMDPKRGEELKAKSVPGLGIASDLQGAKDLREMQATVKTVNSGIKRLKEIAKMTGKSISPNLSAEAETIRRQLIGRLRVPLTGTGAMSDGDRQLLESIIPDVTSIFSLDSSNIKKLDTIEKGVLNGYRNQAIANGLKVADQPQKDMSKQQQAMEWLQKNPNHPQAAAIRKQLGL